ncbi:hypothetical protein COLO4_31463 [Corchorus olitorius]|uniref:Uncharacterized protein n=1 Tax=Corchorus olitorius TaxID=93759 RepID=A0A1R3H4G3_9ROSI|nr:hypothetical protein COLO4_31463 [Corchorus olitorius]
MEDWEFEYWPHRMTFQEIDAATNGFSEENVIGVGGNGKVYKGVLPGGTEIAKVKATDMWANYSQSSGHGYPSHPTFEDIRQANSSSMSLSWTNTIMEDLENNEACCSRTAR